MTTLTMDEETPILVEFTPRPGVQEVSRLSAKDLVEKSARALDYAMGTIHQMARRVSTLHDTLPDEFTQVELEFGVKLDAEAGAFLSKVGGEANINVTLTWKRPESRQAASKPAK
jgi:hypothetical protein